MTQLMRLRHDKAKLSRSAYFSKWTARLMRVLTPALRNGYRHSGCRYLGEVTTPNGGVYGKKGDSRIQAAGGVHSKSVALPKSPSRRLASSTGWHPGRLSSVHQRSGRAARTASARREPECICVEFTVADVHEKQMILYGMPAQELDFART